MDQGYVKLWRRLKDTEFWLHEKFTRPQAWVDLIMLANHKSGMIRKRGIPVEVQRGQVGWSEDELAKRWKWSRGKVRRFLSELCSENEQKIVQQKSNVTSLIDLINYNLYQGDGTADSTANGHQTDTKRYRNKNEKNEKKVSRAKKFVPPTQNEVIDFFIQHGYRKDAAITAWNHYERADPPWTDVKGNRVRSWKQKMGTVWFRDEHKAPVQQTIIPTRLNPEDIYRNE